MTTSDAPSEIELVISSDAAGQRLDVAIAALAPQLSRSYIARLLKDGAVGIVDVAAAIGNGAEELAADLEFAGDGADVLVLGHFQRLSG